MKIAKVFRDLLLIGTTLMIGMAYAQTNCTASVSDTSGYAEIREVKIGGIVKTPGTLVDASKGQEVPITIETGIQGPMELYVSVFVDLNRDGIYTADERQYYSMTRGAILEGKIKLPASVTNGTMGVRVVASTDSTGLGCGYVGWAGEIEDYSFNIREPKICEIKIQNAYYSTINSVTVGGVTNSPPQTGSGTPGYSDSTSVVFQPAAGSTAVPFSISATKPAGPGSGTVELWVDFNGDKLWTPNEKVFDNSWPEGSQSGAPTQFSGSFLIPKDAPPGKYTVRVMQYAGKTDLIGDNPCGTIAVNGLVVDYTLEISCKRPILDPRSVGESPTLCSPASHTFSVKNPVSGVSYNWYDIYNGPIVGTGSSRSYSGLTGPKTVWLEAQTFPNCTSDKVAASVNVINCCPVNKYTIKTKYTEDGYYLDSSMSIEVTNTSNTEQVVTIEAPQSTNFLANPSSKMVTIPANKAVTVTFSGSFIGKKDDSSKSEFFPQIFNIRDNKNCSYSLQISIAFRDQGLPLGGNIKIYSQSNDNIFVFNSYYGDVKSYELKNSAGKEVTSDAVTYFDMQSFRLIFSNRSQFPSGKYIIKFILSNGKSVTKNLNFY
jgi:hypothetical protein